MGKEDRDPLKHSFGSTKRDPHVEDYETSPFSNSPKKRWSRNPESHEIIFWKENILGLMRRSIDSVVSVLETVLSACEVNDDEKLAVIPAMLSGDALIHYFSNIQGSPTMLMQ